MEIGEIVLRLWPSKRKFRSVYTPYKNYLYYLFVVIGIHESIEVLIDGLQVVLDAKRGVVYERPQALAHAVQ